MPLGERAHRARGRARARVLAYGAMVPVALEAAHAGGRARLVGRGASTCARCVPLDTEPCSRACARPGASVILHEAPRTCGYGAELAALIAEQALTSLQAPVLRVTGYDTPFPYTLEHTYLPDAPRVLRAIEHVMSY